MKKETTSGAVIFNGKLNGSQQYDSVFAKDLSYVQGKACIIYTAKTYQNNHNSPIILSRYFDLDDGGDISSRHTYEWETGDKRTGDIKTAIRIMEGFPELQKAAYLFDFIGQRTDNDLFLYEERKYSDNGTKINVVLPLEDFKQKVTIAFDGQAKKSAIECYLGNASAALFSVGTGHGEKIGSVITSKAHDSIFGDKDLGDPLSTVRMEKFEELYKFGKQSGIEGTSVMKQMKEFIEGVKAIDQAKAR